MKHATLVIAAMLAGVAAPAAAQVGFRTFATGFNQPVFLTGRGNDVFVVQQGGVIERVNRSTKARTPFLTVPGIETGGEKGLLGFAFDPRFGSNGRVYVNVTTRIDGQLYVEVRRYTVATGSIPAADPLVIMRTPKRFDNHNGGWIGFGADGNLLVATGDGGASNDPDNNAQNLDSRLGKMLRVDVRGDGFPADPARNYRIPAGNPFGTEVLAYGLRNPWRASVDRTTGDIHLGDVGQGAREEINRIAGGTSGQNFGWRPLEGDIPTPGIGEPAPAGAVAPIFAYPHSQGRSVTGGFVYRGGIDAFTGRYVFGDFITGRLWSMAPTGGDVRDETGLLSGFGGVNIASFGEDATRGLYVLGYDGRILQLSGFVPRTTGGPLAASSIAQLTAAPEPATWAMLILGFGLVGAAARRRSVLGPIA